MRWPTSSTTAATSRHKHGCGAMGRYSKHICSSNGQLVSLGFGSICPVTRVDGRRILGPLSLVLAWGHRVLALKTAACMADVEVYNALNRSAGPSYEATAWALCTFHCYSRLARLGTDLLATSIKLCADTRITSTKRTTT